LLSPYFLIKLNKLSENSEIIPYCSEELPSRVGLGEGGGRDSDALKKLPFG